MKRTYYTIPTSNLTHTSNQETIKAAIKKLSDYYLINWEVMDDSERLSHLEIIANLTNIYFDMVLVEVDD